MGSPTTPSLPIVPHRVHQGADASLDEIDKLDGPVGAIERLFVPKRNTVKMRAKPLVISGRQQTEQSVGMLLRSLASGRHLTAPLVV
jgi:hypothetical protein